MPILKVCTHRDPISGKPCKQTYQPQREVTRCPEHHAAYTAQRNARRKAIGNQTYDSPAFRKAQGAEGNRG
jgi:hypothetical protein